MQIKIFKGNPTVILTKPEQKKLADAAQILDVLARHAQCGLSDDAAAALAALRAKYGCGEVDFPSVMEPEE